MESKTVLPAKITFWQQVRALTWKNFLLKRRHWKISILEFLFPILYCVTFLATIGAFSVKGTGIDDYFHSQEFYVFTFYLGVLTLTYISLVRFINFQVPREIQINVESTLKIMNVSKFASEVSFILAQQPALFTMMIATALVQYVFPLLKGDTKNIASNKFLMLLVLTHLETIVLCSILTSRMSQGSILISTQIGQLVQYFLIAFFYLALGRFQIDLFHTKGRDVNKDWIIYMVILLVFLALYGMVACFDELKMIYRRRRFSSNLNETVLSERGSPQNREEARQLSSNEAESALSESGRVTMKTSTDLASSYKVSDQLSLEVKIQ